MKRRVTGFMRGTGAVRAQGPVAVRITFAAISRLIP